MRFSVPLRIFITIGLVVPRPADGAVTLNVGYMDEELSYLTREIAKAQRDGQPLVIVENGHWNGGLLFQQTLEQLLPGQSQRFVVYHVDPDGVSTVRGPAAGDLAGRRLATSLSREMRTVGKEFARLKCDQGPPPETKGDGKFTVFSLIPAAGDAQTARDATVVVRSPEFGRQAPLVKAMLQRMVHAVKAMPQSAADRGGVALTSYGTGGAVSEDIKIGSSHKVDASIYLGYEIERAEGASAPLYRGSVRLVESNGRSTQFLLTDPFGTRQEAENFARQSLRDGLLGALRPPAGGAGATLATRLDTFRAEGKTVTLTTSFFGSHEDKAAAAQLGLTSINMEDAHILGLAKGVRVVDAVRLISDPAHIDSEVTKRILSWSKSHRYTQNTYVNAILWGLEGQPLDRIPPEARWTAFDGLPSDVVGRNIVSLPAGPDGKTTVLDPFFVEMSSRLVEDASMGRLFDSNSVSTKIQVRLSQAAQAQLGEALRQAGEQLQGQALLIKRLNASGDTRNLAMAVQEFVLLLGSVDVRRFPLLSSELAAFAPEVFEDGRGELLLKHGRLALFSREPSPAEMTRGEMDIWVRFRKWGMNATNKLNYVGPSPDRLADALELPEGSPELERYAGAVADRSIYRASMTPAAAAGASARATQLQQLSERLQSVATANCGERLRVLKP